MSKFEKVKIALEGKTRNSSNLTVIKNTDARHTGKYVLKNVLTNNVKGKSYKTLNEIVKEFKLII